MGAPFTFECRRQELQELDMPSSDRDVVGSFIDSISIPKGELMEYLSFGKLSVIIGDTIYVHGGITKFGLG
jgi:hypothetical protein